MTSENINNQISNINLDNQMGEENSSNLSFDKQAQADAIYNILNNIIQSCNDSDTVILEHQIIDCKSACQILVCNSEKYGSPKYFNNEINEAGIAASNFDDMVA